MPRREKKVFRHQPQVRGEVKIPTPSSMPPALRNAIERDALRFQSSRSWIVVSALAAFYDIDVFSAFARNKKGEVPKNGRH